MLLHTPPKYHNQRPPLKCQSSPVSDLTPVWPFLMWLTAQTKEPQWSVATEVLGHPLATAGADRGKVSGSGVTEMPHARSSVTCLDPSRMTVDGFESRAQSPLQPTAYGWPQFHSGYHPPSTPSPPVCMACDLREDPNWTKCLDAMW